MQQQFAYILRGGLISLALLACLVALYITVGWMIVSIEAPTLQEAIVRYDAMFPAFLHGTGVRQLVSFFASAAAFALSAYGLSQSRRSEVAGLRRVVALAVMILSPIMAVLNLFWLM